MHSVPLRVRFWKRSQVNFSMSSVKHQRKKPHISSQHNNEEQKQKSLVINDLDKVIRPCSKYYGSIETIKSIKYLKQWYKDQQFDDDDFENDWIPNDYDNCDGIDIFMNKLNYPDPVSNDTNKRILFEWFCHWLLPSEPEPKKEPQRPPSSSNERTLTGL